MKLHFADVIYDGVKRICRLQSSQQEPIGLKKAASMRNYMHSFAGSALAFFLVVAGTPSLAQSDEWAFEGSLYVFAADTTLNVGGTKTELSFSDALDNLDVAAMGTLAASKGRWSFVADVMYFNLGFKDGTPGNLFSRVDTDSKTTLFTAVALYRVHEAPGISLDLGGGFQHFRTSTELTLQPGLLPKRRLKEKDNWTDPIIAARARFELSDKWGATLFGGYGNFVNDRKTYQALFTLNYDFAESWSARFGYRYVNVKNDDEDFRFKQSGPVLGVTYKF
jgi:opacity protein-like surface antigen